MGERLKGPKKYSYLKDFKQNNEGGYTYSGATYVLDDEKKSYKTMLVKLWLLCVADFVALVVAGCIPDKTASKCVYVIIPLAASIICCFLSCWSLMKITLSVYPLREYIYKIIVSALPLRVLLTTVFSAVTLVAEIVFSIYFGYHKGIYTYIFVILLFISSIIAFVFFKLLKSFCWKQNKNKETEQNAML